MRFVSRYYRYPFYTEHEFHKSWKHSASQELIISEGYVWIFNVKYVPRIATGVLELYRSLTHHLIRKLTMTAK